MLQTTNSYIWWILRIHLGVYQAIRQEKVCTQGQLKLTHINFAILNKELCKSYLSKICQKHLFLGSKKQNLETAVLAFFKQENLLYIK